MGVEVVAITAEPGGEAMVRERLAARGVPELDFPVRSDPDHHAFIRTVRADLRPRDIFVVDDCDEEGVSAPYRMIQPALVVYDADGAPIHELTWSWKTMMAGLSNGSGDNDDKAVLAWNTVVDTQPSAGPVKQVLLVTMRPVMSDLLAAIQERRPVKLASTHQVHDTNLWT
jgi:hypothetical protein